jgi:hypothetical protein
MIARQKDYKKSFMSAVAGMLLVALCCFTPLLVIVLSLVGLSFLPRTWTMCCSLPWR